MTDSKEEIIGYINIIPAVQKVMDAARTTLAKLNQLYGTGIGIKFVPVEYLRKHAYLKETYMGFVKRDEPFHIYIVPENIFTVAQAEDTTRHEYRHALDLTCNPATDSDCPVNPTPEERERRAEKFEKASVLSRPSEILARAMVAEGPRITCPLCEVVKGEARTREKLFDAYRELAAAEGHIFGIRGDMAKRIRDIRKAVEKVLWPFIDG